MSRRLIQRPRRHFVLGLHVRLTVIGVQHLPGCVVDLLRAAQGALSRPARRRRGRPTRLRKASSGGRRRWCRGLASSAQWLLRGARSFPWSGRCCGLAWGRSGRINNLFGERGSVFGLGHGGCCQGLGLGHDKSAPALPWS